MLQRPTVKYSKYFIRSFHFLPLSVQMCRTMRTIHTHPTSVHVQSVTTIPVPVVRKRQTDPGRHQTAGRKIKSPETAMKNGSRLEFSQFQVTNR